MEPSTNTPSPPTETSMVPMIVPGVRNARAALVLAHGAHVGVDVAPLQSRHHVGAVVLEPEVERHALLLVAAKVLRHERWREAHPGGREDTDRGVLSDGWKGHGDRGGGEEGPANHLSGSFDVIGIAATVAGLQACEE